MNYLFTLGRTIPLCLAELETIFKINEIKYKILEVIENHVIVEAEDKLDAQSLVKQSGGIVKISKKILTNTNQYYPILTNTNKNEIRNYKNFGVSLVGFQENIVKICEELKKDLKMHYILPKEGHELSSAQIINKNILELMIVKTVTQYQIFQTVAVQNINYWTRKDMGRPFIDDRLGMLPLKVGRMMINLGRGSLEGKKEAKNNLLDPFCGMGSILVEAIDLGFADIIGGDIQEDILQNCQKNVEWFKKEFKYSDVKVEFFLSDATKISETLLRLKATEGQEFKKVDLIVTEPFLGDAQKIKRISELTNMRIKGDMEKNIKNILKGLEKMYLGCLKEWRKILKSEGIVCIVVPEIVLVNQLFTLPFIEICAKTGYNILAQYEYSRETAIVKRKIFLLKI